MTDFTHFADDDAAAPWMRDPQYGGMRPASARRSWKAAQGTAPTKQSLKGKGQFELLRLRDVKVDEQRRGYLLKGLLASTGLSVVWGPPKCGKSFWAMDVGLHIALNMPYRGLRVQQAPVVYVALEGQHGIPARIEAFKRHHNVADAPFYLVLTRLNLIAEADALVKAIADQIGAVLPGAVFIDTLNRSLVGSESKDEDMAKYLSAAEYVAEKLSAAVVIIHHCGIDTSRPRGHTSLTGSVEGQIQVKRGEAGEVIAVLEWAKDMPDGLEICSRLEQVKVGTDPDGDDITTLIVLPAERSASSGPKVRGAKKVALEILRQAIDETGEVAPASNHIPPNTRTTSMEHWRRYAYAGGISDGDDPDSKRRAFVRAAKDLQVAGLIGKWNDHVWIV
jgi:hypothetical protein